MPVVDDLQQCVVRVPDMNLVIKLPCSPMTYSCCYWLSGGWSQLMAKNSSSHGESNFPLCPMHMTGRKNIFLLGKKKTNKPVENILPEFSTSFKNYMFLLAL